VVVAEQVVDDVLGRLGQDGQAFEVGRPAVLRRDARVALERVESAPQIKQRVHARLILPIELQGARQRRGDERPRVTPEKRFEALLFPRLLHPVELTAGLAIVPAPVAIAVVFVLLETDGRDLSGQPEGGRLLHGHAHGARDRLGVVVGRLDLREERLQLLDDAGRPHAGRARPLQGGDRATGDIEHARA